MKKNKIPLIIIICSLMIIIIMLCIVLHREFNRLENPIMAGFGLVKIKVLNIDYILIQENPKVIIAKPDNDLNRLEEYMGNQGFKLVERLGSWVVFENERNEKQSFSYRVNKHYSIWEWE